jgi:hypothetical protein
MIYLVDPQEAGTINGCIVKFCGKMVPLYGINPTPI